MKQIKPFVGRFYNEGINGKRIVVIGHQKKNDGVSDLCLQCRHCESVTGPCYSDDDNESLINDLINNVKWEPGDDRSYVMFARMFTNNDFLQKDSEEWRNFWNHIAFFNFIQRHSLETTGREEDSEYEKMLDVALNHIEKLQPDVVICWGTYFFPYILRQCEEIDSHTCSLKLHMGKIVRFLQMHHPSQGFSYKVHRDMLKELGLYYKEQVVFI